MDRLRPFLCWLLCALLVGAGVPTRARSSCHPQTAAGGAAATTSAPGCCRPDDAVPMQHCSCPQMAKANCDCEKPHRDPAPAPQPQKQPLLANSREPVTEPACALVAPRSFAPTTAAPRAPPCILPACSRQEALSIWRC